MNISERNVIIKSKHIRNNDGIKKHAVLKSQKASQKGDQAIQNLIKTNTKINFNQVAMESGVSKAFLYKGSCRIILDNVIGYKKGKTKSYIRNEIEFVVINETKGSYELYKIEKASEKDIERLKEMKKLE
uniref:DUF6262 family protein n=1 Tax=Bacillus sp. TH45 TaxID=2796409 RepID=UPI0027DD49FF|nr:MULTISPECIES: DUF6262 family protein [unclassified Bacillus (in: firmicutes)]